MRLGALELNNVVTYTVIIEAENDDRKLLPGMTANARIETAKRDMRCAFQPMPCASSRAPPTWRRRRPLRCSS